jgi:ABC-type transporter Mla subunit MlaD
MKNIFKTKKTSKITTPPSTEEVIASAQQKILNDIDTLSNQKDSALSVFRQTANKLETVNKGLTKSVADLDKLIKFASEHKSNAEKIISDNESVRNKILDIIGK